MSAVLRSAGTIPMTPDNSVVWHRFDVPSLDGELLLAPNAPRDTAYALLRYAQDADCDYGQSLIPTPDQLEHPLEGVYGRIAPVGDMALKVFKPEKLRANSDTDNDCAAGLSGLRINHMMSVGLERTQRNMPSPKTPRLAAPEQFGAFFAKNWSSYEAYTPAVWAMRYVAGVQPFDLDSLIPQRTRQRFYQRALASCGVEGGDLSVLYLHDDTARNALVTDNGARIVRLDFMARPALRGYFEQA